MIPQIRHHQPSIIRVFPATTPSPSSLATPPRSASQRPIPHLAKLRASTGAGPATTESVFFDTKPAAWRRALAMAPSASIGTHDATIKCWIGAAVYECDEASGPQTCGITRSTSRPRRPSSGRPRSLPLMTARTTASCARWHWGSSVCDWTQWPSRDAPMTSGSSACARPIEWK
jgi:hypothetical protein